MRLQCSSTPHGASPDDDEPLERAGEQATRANRKQRRANAKRSRDSQADAAEQGAGAVSVPASGRIAIPASTAAAIRLWRYRPRAKARYAPPQTNNPMAVL